MKLYKHIVFFLVMAVAAWPSVSLEIQNVDTEAGILDIYMINEEEIGGFQIELTGISIAGASAPAGFMVSTSTTTILAFSLTGATIPIGEGILTQVTYSFEGGSICFGEDTGSSGGTAISDGSGTYIAADWGDCYCEMDLDCAGECGGTAVEDECGICNGSGIPSENCDCYGNVDDECNVCGGDNSTCSDCADVPNGDNVEDNCGICDNDASNDCVQDCFGEWGGSAELDECFVCGGDGPMDGFDCAGNCTENCEYDCFDVFQGTGKFDDCSTCIDCSQFVEDCTQHPAWNQSCMDCTGELNGNAFVDACEICVDGTPHSPGCIFDCEGLGPIDPNWAGAGSIDNCGVCDSYSDNDCEIDCNGDWGGTALIDNCGHCVYGETGQEPCTQDCNGDWGGTAVIDDCNICDGTNACFDCSGIPNGNAVIDNCGTCDSDYSNDCVPDCNGEWGGPDNIPDSGDEATVDECGICGGSGIVEGACDCFDNVVDACGVCGGSNSCFDCANIPNGNNIEDNCGNCDDDPSNDCTPDCNGVWGGEAEFDNCGFCDNDIENDCTQDCFGAWGGTAVEDECGVCAGSGIVDGACDCEGNIVDCLGVCGGTAIEDCLGECDGPAVEDIYNNCCSGTPAIDDCGVCYGDNSLCTDCCGVLNGSGDSCDGECGPCNDDIDEGTCDCEGNLNDECGVCGGDNSSCSWTNLTVVVEEINNISLSWDAIDIDSRTTSNRSSGNRNRDCSAEVCLSIENVDIDAGTLDIYMINSEAVGGWQFELPGITITDATVPAGFLPNSTSTTVLSFSLTGATVEPGDGVLTQVSFTDFAGTDICFGTNSTNNVISDPVGAALYTNWGDCACPAGLDACGVCGGSGISDGYCDCYGNSEDLCGVCAGDNSSCADCAGIPNGDSELDNCGTCDNDSSNDCDMDCFGVWGGTAVEDECGECGGPGLGNGSYFIDCWNGNEYCNISDCPINPEELSYNIYRSGLGIPIAQIQQTNYTDIELNYNTQYCYTVTYVNGSEESSHSDQACEITGEMVPIEGCMSTYACNYDETANVDDGSCWFANTGCSCDHVQGALADLCGVCDTDFENDCTVDCTGVPGGNTVEDDCGVCNGDNSSCSDCSGTPNGDAVEDCNGDCEGSGYIDQCGECVGGNTDEIPCQRDCAGFWGGDLIGQGVFECIGVANEENDPSDHRNQNDCEEEGFFWLQIGNDLCDVCGGDDSSCYDDCGEPNGKCFETGCTFCDGTNPAEDFVDCNPEGTICEEDSDWSSDLGNGSWNAGEEYTDQNNNGKYDVELCDECADCAGNANGIALIETVDEDWLDFWGVNEPQCCESGELDLCGVCDGPGRIYECDCIGLPVDENPLSPTYGNQACNCDGDVIMDDCGSCGGSNYFMIVTTDISTPEDTGDCDDPNFNIELELTGDYCNESDGYLDNELGAGCSYFECENSENNDEGGTWIFDSTFDIIECNDVNGVYSPGVDNCILVDYENDSNYNLTDYCDCDGNIIDVCGDCGGSETNLDNCDIPPDCAGVEGGSAVLDQCGNCYDGTKGVCLVDGIAINNLENNQSDCLVYGECRIDGDLESTWDFAGLDTTDTELNSEQLCENILIDGDNVVGACKIGESQIHTWDFAGLDTTETVLDKNLCLKKDEDDFTLVGKCTVSEWIFDGADTTTVLNNEQDCLSLGVGTCSEETEIKDQETCDCTYGEGTWKPSQWNNAIWYTGIWTDAVWDPTNSDDFSDVCVPDCSETYKECCENSNGTWDSEYGTCDKDTNDNDNDDTTWDGTSCWGNVDDNNFAVEDCNGDCNGDAVEDNCGTCDEDISNDCVPDCTSLEENCGGTWLDGQCWGGDRVNACFTVTEISPDSTEYKVEFKTVQEDCQATDFMTIDDNGDTTYTYPYISFATFSSDGSDDCGSCPGINYKGASGSFENGTLEGQCSCAGQCSPEYEEYFDECGECDNDLTNDCEIDCAGVWGGTAVEDCNDVCGGPGLPDDCGECTTSECDLSICNEEEECIDNDGIWTEGECDLSICNEEEECTDNDGEWIILGNFFTEGSEDILSTLYGCENFYLGEDGTNAAPTTKQECEDEYFDGEWGLMGSQWEMLNPNGECDCNGNMLDCAGVCGGDENTESDSCSTDFNDFLCHDDYKDDCGNCYGNGIEEGACDCFGNKLNCAGECPTIPDPENIGVYISNPDWEPITGIDVDGDGICDDQDDCVSDPLNNKHLFYMCDINVSSGICPEENLSVALDPDGNQNTNYGGFDICGICNGNGFSCGFEVEGGVNEIKLSWRKPFSDQIDSALFDFDTTLGRSHGNTIISSELNGLYSSAGSAAGDNLVKLEKKNIDIDAGTLDIYMTNIPGCSYCSDPAFIDNQIGCEMSGNNTAGADWIVDPTMSESACESIGSPGGIWFDGYIGGFQFELIGILMSGASGGTAEAAGFIVNTSPTTVLGFSMTGATIPIGENSLLTTITFTTSPDYDETGICFGEDTGSAGGTALSDGSGAYVVANWESCDCSEENPADACGICGGDGMPEGACDCDGNVDSGCGCGESAPSSMCPWAPDVKVCSEYECPPDPNAVSFNIYRDNAVGDLIRIEEGWIYNSYIHPGLNWDASFKYAISYTYENQEYFYTAISKYDDNQNSENAVRIPGVADSEVLGCLSPSSCTYDNDNPANSPLENSCWWPTYGCSCESPQYSVVDECGECGGDSSSCFDCADQPNGDGYIDNCGDCVGGDTGLIECVADCNNEWGGTAVVDECGECGGDGTSCLSLYNGLIPDDYSIHDIYPNPFNPYANIVYGIPELSNVKVTVYDLHGRQIAVLQNEIQNPGYYAIKWDATQYSSGVYFVEMLSDDFRQIKRVLHMK